MQLELALLHRTPQIDLKPVPCLSIRVHVGIEETQISATVHLGAIHRKIGGT